MAAVGLGLCCLLCIGLGVGCRLMLARCGVWASLFVAPCYGDVSFCYSRERLIKAFSGACSWIG